MGKSLQNEIQKHYGPFSEEALEQSYDKVKGSGRAAVTSPQQRLIDDLLARRSIQQYDREERISQAHRQLKEERERLNRELRALRLQREHKEVIVLPHHHNDASALQARIQLRAERLPAMEAEVRNLRELLQKECLSESIIPVQPNSSKTVHQSVSEGVAELMDNELHVSPAIDPRSAQSRRQLSDRLMKEFQAEQVSKLIMEQLVLETTLEFSKETAQTFYNIHKMCEALSFDAVFNSIKKAVPGEQALGKGNSDDLTPMILTQQRDRAPQ
ncbi:uncharacterized protein LOC136766441 isoform X3 [Amia ocellicauda]